MQLWGYQIWLEMWLGGMAGGAFITAFMYQLFSGGKNRSLLRGATFLAIPLVIIALLLSLIDLGEPMRFWHMLVSIRPESPLWLGAFLLQPFVGLCIINAILYLVDARKGEEGSKGIRAAISVFSWIALLVALALIAYSGVLLTSTGVPLWAGTVILPPLFVTSAVATGIALLIFSVLIYRSAWGISAGTVKQLAAALPVIVVIQVLLIGGLIVLAGSSAELGASAASKILTSGSLMIPFFADLAALVLSIVLIIVARAKEIDKGAMRGTAILASLLVILGGLAMRAIIIIGGQS